MTNKREDAALAARAARGDTLAFEELFLRNQSMVYHLALRISGDREDALDISQEAFLKAWRALPSFRAQSSFSTWMYRITLNAASDYLEQRKRRSTLPLESGESREACCAGEGDPVDKVLQGERIRELDRAVSALSAEHREILFLREIEGYRYEELASMLRLELGTVKSRLRRARVELRRILSEMEQK